MSIGCGQPSGACPRLFFIRNDTLYFYDPFHGNQFTRRSTYFFRMMISFHFDPHPYKTPEIVRNTKTPGGYVYLSGNRFNGQTQERFVADQMESPR